MVELCQVVVTLIPLHHNFVFFIPVQYCFLWQCLYFSLQTATLYPGIVFGTCFFLNFFIWGKQSSGAVSCLLLSLFFFKLFNTLQSCFTLCIHSEVLKNFTCEIIGSFYYYARSSLHVVWNFITSGIRWILFWHQEASI